MLPPFGFLAPKDFQIIWLSNLLILSVHDEGYFRNALRARNPNGRKMIAKIWEQETQTVET
jgi:hypothetical protein